MSLYEVLVLGVAAVVLATFILRDTSYLRKEFIDYSKPFINKETFEKEIEENFEETLDKYLSSNFFEDFEGQEMTSDEAEEHFDSMFPKEEEEEDDTTYRKYTVTVDDLYEWVKSNYYEELKSLLRSMMAVNILLWTILVIPFVLLLMNFTWVSAFAFPIIGLFITPFKVGITGAIKEDVDPYLVQGKKIENSHETIENIAWYIRSQIPWIIVFVFL